MLTIQFITSMGLSLRIDVEQMQFVRTCPYCGEQFQTVNIDQKYCKVSHGIRMSERRRIVKECRAG